jgi:hypothetical protein
MFISLCHVIILESFFASHNTLHQPVNYLWFAYFTPIARWAWLVRLYQPRAPLANLTLTRLANIQAFYIHIDLWVRSTLVDGIWTWQELQYIFLWLQSRDAGKCATTDVISTCTTCWIKLCLLQRRYTNLANAEMRIAWVLQSVVH